MRFSIERRWTRFVLLATLLGVALEGRTDAAEGFGQAVAGYRVCDRLALDGEEAVGGLAYAPDGSLLVLVGGDVRRYTDGQPFSRLASLGEVFGSFLTLAPDGESLIAGESSNGGVHRIPLLGGEAVLMDSIPFNYDLAFDDEGRGYVSAGLGGGQFIVRLDEDPDAEPQSVIAGIPGFSGPLATDAGGFLYYGTADLQREVQSIVRFSPEQLAAADAGDVLDFGDGETVVTELTSVSNMRFHDGRLIATDLGFVSPLGAGSVQAVDPMQDVAAETLVTLPFSDGILSPTLVATHPGTAPFEPGAGETGGRVAIVYSNFAGIQRVAEITASRPLRRGELNGDDEIDLSDAVFLLNFLFLGGSEPDPLPAADINADADTDLSDAIYLLNFLFLGGAAIPG